MSRLHDLPGPAISSSIQRARARRIPGTNKFARVCQSWRDASVYGDNEQLQLLLDLDNLQGDDLESALAWLRQHGGCVTDLYVSGIATPCWSVMEQLLATPHTWSSTLTRLELEGSNALVPLAPHLHQLPSLQHLTASIIQDVTDNGGQVQLDPDLPNLGQLCPQLSGLCLELSYTGAHTISELEDDGLFTVLPVDLQRLHLTARGMVVDASPLTQLTALGHLTLEAWGLDNSMELLGMSRLQQLELWVTKIGGIDLVSLASKLVGVWSGMEVLPAATLSQLTGLTALACRACGSLEDEQERPVVNPLLGLASLRVLRIVHMDDLSHHWLLEGLSSVSSLRSFSVIGPHREDVLAVVGKMTQLTGLELLAIACEHPLPSSGQPSPSSWSSLQQLTGLQRLLFDRAWVSACDREQLAVLTQLTELVVRGLGAAERVDPRQLLAPLSGLLPTLQQVVCVHDGRSPSPSRPWGDQPAEEVVPSPLPGVRVMLSKWSVRLNRATLRPRRTRACPHLPGVWEVWHRRCWLS
jgi:hypothetical protein